MLVLCVFSVCTCAGCPHEGREYSITPFIGGEVIFTIQLSQAHCFGVQRIFLLCHKVQSKKEKMTKK